MTSKMEAALKVDVNGTLFPEGRSGGSFPEGRSPRVVSKGAFPEGHSVRVVPKGHV